MHPPHHLPRIHGEIADYYWEEDGLLISYSKRPKRTVENITANGALVKQITDNKRVPLMIYLSNSPVPHKRTRKFATEQLPVIYSAMAMISEPGLAQFIMNMLFRFQSPPIPMKSFINQEQARAWLKNYL